MREASAPVNRFAVLAEEVERPAAVVLPPVAPVRPPPSAAPPLPKFAESSAAGGAGGAGAEANPAPVRFSDRLRQTGGARPAGPRHAPPKLDSETEFPTLGGGASRCPNPVSRTPYSFAGSFADKAREAAAQEAREAEERATAEAHRQAELARERYERSLLVSRFSGMNFYPRDDTAARSAAYEEEDRLRGMEVHSGEEEVAEYPGTPPYPPAYEEGADEAAEESKGNWDTSEQEEAW
jgi:hypothetical protein